MELKGLILSLVFPLHACISGSDLATRGPPCMIFPSPKSHLSCNNSEHENTPPITARRKKAQDSRSTFPMVWTQTNPTVSISFYRSALSSPNESSTPDMDNRMVIFIFSRGSCLPIVCYASYLLTPTTRAQKCTKWDHLLYEANLGKAEVW